MATLEEVIRQRLAEATTQVEEAKKIDIKKPESEEVGGTDVVDTKPAMKKTLCKEDLDEMSQEEFDSIDEEQLDELSKATLGNYIKKATPDAANKLARASLDLQDGKTLELRHTRVDRGVENLNSARDRIYNVNKAVDRLTKEDTVSSQVSALLEAEGLSEDFKVQAVTIFEAAVTDRVLVLQEELEKEFESQLAEAKEEMNNDIDGFLNEAIQQWKTDNEVAIKANFKAQVAESFMDGLQALMGEHNVEIAEGKEDALATAMGEVDKLNESIVKHESEMAELQEQISVMKAKQILESFKEKMTLTEFDRFTQLTESVKFVDESQYEKQLTVVLENFGQTKSAPAAKVVQEVITESVSDAIHIVTESNSDVAAYARYLSKK
jgi:hypothetical protein